MAFSSSTHFLPPPLPIPKTLTPKFLSIRCSSSSSSSSSNPTPHQSTSAPRPPSPSTFDLRSYWTDLLSEINANLNSAIPVRYPSKIFLSMRHAVLSPSAKRAPPVMCIASFDLLSPAAAPRAAVLPTAAALEMVHSASLIHDDLPSFDSATSRRGLPSTHSLFGVDTAVLAGDALFPLAFQHIISSTPSHLVPDPSLLRVVQLISRTVLSMAAGQFIDLDPDNLKREDEVVSVIEEKFGALAECSAVCGGLLAGAGEGELERLGRYGRALGVLYEVVDDVLMEGQNGNPTSSSAKMRSNASVVKVVGIERAMEMVEELRGTAKRELEEFGDKYGDKVIPLYSFVDYAVERGFVVESHVAA